MAGEKTRKEIVKASREGLVRLSSPLATLVGMSADIPLLGVGVSSVFAVAWLGRRAFSLMGSSRVRYAMELATEEGDWSAFYREQVKQGAGERLRKELLELLRDLDDAVCDEAVEPLTLLFAFRARGDVEWVDARMAATLLRRASDDELKALREMLSKGLEYCEDEQLTFLRSRRVADDRPVFLVWSHLGNQVELDLLPEVPSVLRLLTVSGAASPYVPSQATAGGNSGGSAEGVVISRPVAEFLFTLLKH